MEVWKIINKFPRYSVSNLGRVKNNKTSRILKFRDRKGYKMVALYFGPKKPKEIMVHHLGLIAFIGPHPQGKECNHKDGDRSNNKSSNLEWLTHSENIKYSYKRLGRLPIRGEKHKNSKLTTQRMFEIRRLYFEENQTQQKISELFGICRAEVGHVVTRKRWQHIA